MSDDRDERIRTRAHEIWEREGRPEGRETAHWDQAAREIEMEEAGSAPAPAGGVASGLQPGGSVPGGGPGAGQGSIGTGGGSTRGKSSGSVKRSRS